ncbi:MAG: hypothetical protein FWD59_10770, partial [Micrococcales bacterium]|nr:hypothetical protein [Micrococcales bacterium]
PSAATNQYPRADEAASRLAAVIVRGATMRPGTATDREPMAANSAATMKIAVATATPLNHRLQRTGLNTPPPLSPPGHRQN